MDKREEYLQQIRGIDGLKNAILCQITLSKREKTAEFFLVTDKAYSAMEEAKALQISQDYLPNGISAKLKIVKRVPDKEMLKKKIYEYICQNFPSAGAFLEEGDIQVEILTSGANFAVSVALFDGKNQNFHPLSDQSVRDEYGVSVHVRHTLAKRAVALDIEL